MKKEFQAADNLIDYFKVSYKQKTSKDLRVNRASAKWQFLDVLKEFSEAEAKKVIDFYFVSNNTHDMSDLLNNFFEYSDGVERSAAAEAVRSKVRQKTKERVEKWQQQKSNL